MTEPQKELQPIIELHNVSMRRDEAQILSDIEWSILPGQHWALLGANGSGKTSLLKIITGYEWPSDGVVKVLGELFGRVDLRELRKTIGLVSSSLVNWFPNDQTALDVSVSGFEASIGLWREFSHEEYAHAREALESIGGGPIMNKPYRVLSQGERQRVMIARALVHYPTLLILDEPCGGLDPYSRETFLRDVTKFASQPDAPTMIFVTHHIEEIPAFVSHALILKDGKISAQGPMETTCTSKFLGEAFGCECEVEKRDERYRLRVLV